MFTKELFTLHGTVASAPFQNCDYSDFGEWALWVDHRPEVIAAVKSDMADSDFDQLVKSCFRLEVKHKSDKKGTQITVLHAFPDGNGHCGIAFNWELSNAAFMATTAFTSTSTSRSGLRSTTWCVFSDSESKVASSDNLSRPPVEKFMPESDRDYPDALMPEASRGA